MNDELYVSLSERIVRDAIGWQGDSGRIIDPFVARETPTATPRFVGALAGLILQGRCLDLAENGRRALTVAAEDLFAAGENSLAGAEFYTKELVLGYLALADTTDQSTVDQWARLIGTFDPEKNYDAVLGKRPAEELHNFCTFGLAGEAMKVRCGLAQNNQFIERHLATQIGRFNSSGQYRDPDCPMTYDAVARMNLCLVLHSGYEGAHASRLDEMLRKGALTMLQCLSTTGEAPYGGRSNQQNFNEATIALICEYEANRYHKLGNGDMAGRFKHTARLATQSVQRWLQLDPVRFTKNEFPPALQHGRQKTYGYYAAYSLLIASQFGFAGWLADSGINEPAKPGENGKQVTRLEDDFHKVFATCGGYHLEIDTCADFHYDATGLGRFHKRGVLSETALSTPIVSQPEYLVSVPPAPRQVAIGPGWLREGKIAWHSDMSAEIKAVEFQRLEGGEEEVSFRVVTHLDALRGSVQETYRLSRSGLEINCEVGGAPDTVFFQVPLLVTDGNHRSEITVEDRVFSVSYQGHTYRVWCQNYGDVETRVEDFHAPNRNGVYKIGVFSVKGGSLECHLSLE